MRHSQPESSDTPSFLTGLPSVTRIAVAVPFLAMEQLEISGNVTVLLVGATVAVLLLVLASLVKWRVKATKAMAEAEQERQATARRFTQSFQNSPVAAFEMGSDLIVARVNHAFEKQMGQSGGELVGLTLSELVGEADAEASHELVRAALASEDQFVQSLVEMRDKYDRPIFIQQSLTVIPATSSMGQLIFVQIEDMTAQHRKHEELEQRALHDPLTGLGNRVLLMQRLDEALGQLGVDEVLGLAFVDLDRFKMVNDSLGHAAGDELIKTVALRLKGAVRSQDTVARFGGDEFVILFPSVSNVEECFDSAERVRQSISRPIELGGRELTVTLSLGLTFGLHGDDSKTLLKQADEALYRSKATGRDRSVLYDVNLAGQRVDQIALNSELQKCLDNDELSIDLEPIFAVRTGRQVGMAADISWRHNDFGELSMAEILPLIDSVGMRETLELWALQTSMKLFDETAQGEHWWLSVKISSETLFGDRLVDVLAAGLEAWRNDPQCLALELSDSAFTNQERARGSVIGPLRELGARVTICESGRRVSLGRMAAEHYDLLKIEKCLVSALDDTARGDTSFESLTGVARMLGIPTIVTGLSSEEEMRLAAEADVTFASGSALVRRATAEAVPS